MSDLEPERQKAINWAVGSVLLGTTAMTAVLALAWPLKKLVEPLPDMPGVAGLLADPTWKPGFSRRWVEDTAAFLTEGLPFHFDAWWPPLWHGLVEQPISMTGMPHWSVMLAAAAGVATTAAMAMANPHDMHRKSHGSAKFASERDIRKAKLYGDAGLVLGRSQSGRLLRLPETTSVILIAPPGAGKTAGILMPCLLAPWREWKPVLGSEALGRLCDRPNTWPENGKRVKKPTWVINDPKGELHRRTAKAMEAKGYRVVKLAFADLASSRWNPIGLDALPGGMRTVELRRCVLRDLGEIYSTPTKALAAIMARVRDSTQWRQELANDPTFRGETPLTSEIADAEAQAILEGKSPVRERLGQMLKDLEDLFALQARREQYVRRIAVMAVDEKIEPHWRDKGRAALVGGLLFTIYRCETYPDKYGEPSIGRFIDFLTEGTSKTQEETGGDAEGEDGQDGNEQMLKDWLAEAERDGHPARVITEFASLVRTPGRERGSILSTMEGGIDIFKNPTVRRTTAASDFALDDMRFGDKPLAIYLVTPLEEAVSMGRVVGMFFESSAARMISQEEKDIEERGRPVIYAADEFWTLPAGMDSLMQIPALGRGQQVSLLLIGQSYGQIAIKINRDAVGVLKGATSTKIVLQQNDLETAKEVSDAVGNRTVRNESETTQQGTAKLEDMFKSSVNASWTGLPLLPPQRLMSLKKMDEQVVLYQGMTDKPIMSATPAWFKDPAMKAQIQGRKEPAVVAWARHAVESMLIRLRLKKIDDSSAQAEDAFQQAAAAAIAKAAQEAAARAAAISAQAGPVPEGASPPPPPDHVPATEEEVRAALTGNQPGSGTEGMATAA